MVDITATSSRKQHSLEMLWLLTFPMGDMQARQKRLIDVFFFSQPIKNFLPRSVIKPFKKPYDGFRAGGISKRLLPILRTASQFLCQIFARAK